MKKFQSTTKILLFCWFFSMPCFFSSPAVAGDVICFKVLNNASCPAGGSVDSKLIRLSSSLSSSADMFDLSFLDGKMSLQPNVSSGKFTISVHWSNDGVTWDSGTVVATGIDSSNDGERYPLNPNGPAGLLKITVTETGGTGSPVITLSLCAD